MNESPKPVTEATAPFTPTTTPAIERANRLMAVRSHPGFRDLIRISQDMVQEAVDANSDYPGWDTQQMIVLQARQKAAKEHHEAFFTRVAKAIEDGVADAREKLSDLPAKTSQEAQDQGDYVRQQVLNRFDEMGNDLRVPGSF